MMPKIKDITDLIEQFAPTALQLEWDNCGFQVGFTDDQATGAILTLDVTEASIDRAIEHGANLIISHHPLLFSGLKSITGRTPAERMVIRAIKNNISIYTSHTNIDAATGGVSWAMAQRLGLTNVTALDPIQGMGCIGQLASELGIEQFTEHVKTRYNLPFVKINTDSPTTIKTVAVMGGSGTSELQKAISLGADAMITGDVKYHDFQRASGSIALIDIGHFESEIDVLGIFIGIIQKKYPTFALHTEKISFSGIK